MIPPDFSSKKKPKKIAFRVVASIFVAVVCALCIWLLVRLFLWNLLAEIARYLLVQYLSIPRVYFWILFLLIASVFALLSLRLSESFSKRSHIEDTQFRKPHVREVAYLLRNRRKPYHQMHLNQHLADLVVRTLALNNRVDPRSIKDGLRTMSLDLPEDLQTFLQNGLQRKVLQPTTRHRWSWLARMDPEDNSEDLMQKAIHFLEEELEKSNDDGHS